MTTKEIIEISVLAVLVLGFGIYYLVKAIKNHWIEKLTATINEAISKAEKEYPNGNGDKKKEIVLEAVKAKCEELGIPYSLLYKLISTLIDKIIANYNAVQGK